jgi:hypothetical protein
MPTAVYLAPHCGVYSYCHIYVSFGISQYKLEGTAKFLGIHRKLKTASRSKTPVFPNPSSFNNATSTDLMKSN